MSNEVLLATEDEIVFAEKEREATYFNSKFNFLIEHKGFRPGKFHLFLGPLGNGKTTVSKSLLVDMVNNNPDCTIGIFFSEEGKKDFLSEVSRHTVLRKLVKDGKINFLSEVDLDQNFGIKELLFEIEELLKWSDILIIDNLTTSKVYLDRNTKDQADIARDLKRIVKKYNKPMIVFAHTSGSTDSSRLLENNDIRGSKTLVNMAEFIYIIQRFETSEGKLTTLRTTKSRGSNTEAFGYFMKFDKETMVYSQSDLKDPVHFKEIIKLFKKTMGYK